jgi:hypothetical protein
MGEKETKPSLPCILSRRKKESKVLNLTLSDLKSQDTATITADTASKVLNCNPHYIRVAARQCPEKLGFPVIVYGSRVKIPRIPFIKFMEGDLT